MQKKCFICIVCAGIIFPILSLALTVEEVLKLKEAGLDNETIGIMMKRESPLGVEEVEDGAGNVSIRYSNDGLGGENSVDQGERDRVEKAWDMLRNIVIDGRK